MNLKEIVPVFRYHFVLIPFSLFSTILSVFKEIITEYFFVFSNSKYYIKKTGFDILKDFFLCNRDITVIAILSKEKENITPRLRNSVSLNFILKTITS